jgi:hypothetical protein
MSTTFQSARLTLEKAKARASAASHAAFLAAGVDTSTLDGSTPGAEALRVASLIGALGVTASREAVMTVASALLAHQAHLDFEAGRAAGLADLVTAPADSIVKPGDRIQDMEVLHPFNGVVRILRVNRLLDGEEGR